MAIPSDEPTRSLPPDDATRSRPPPGVHDPAGSTIQAGRPDTAGDATSPHSDADSAEPKLPAAADRYDIGELIAHGGMGSVYTAHDRLLARSVAIKTLRCGPEELPLHVRRFVTEARISARLQHPAIPPVHDLGILSDGRLFLAMKLIGGQTLAGLLNDRPSPGHELPRFIQVFEQIAQGVGFAHAAGVIHRDLKPHNVMVGTFGEVQVMDWGLAKETRSVEHVLPIEDRGLGDTVSCPPTTPGLAQPSLAQPERTAAGAVLGTLAFMAPEQARGETARVGPRADVFALGGILCSTLTGQPPFTGDRTTMLAHARAGRIEEAFAKLDRSGADSELVALAKRCLSPDQSHRPADGKAVADAIAVYRAGVEFRLQAAERAAAAAAERRRRRQVQASLVGAVGLLVLGGLGFAWWQDRQAADRRVKDSRTRQGVETGLRLATDRRGELKFREAGDALAQVDELLAGGAADDLRPAAERARADLDFVKELDDIRYRKWVWAAGSGLFRDFDLASAPPAYRAAFAASGFDLSAGDTTDLAGRVNASPVRPEVVAALDDWALYELDPSLKARLLEVARRADPGPWQDRLRDPRLWAPPGRQRHWWVGSVPVLILAQLAIVADATTPPAAVSTLAELMDRHGLDPSPLLFASAARDPTRFEPAFALGRWFQARDPARAIGFFQAARSIRPDHLAATIELSILVSQSGDTTTAQTLLLDLRRRHPAVAAVHNNLGRVLLSRNDLDAATAAFDEALRLDPQYAAARSNRGAVFAARKDWAAAVADFRAAVAIDPRLAMARVNLGTALVNFGRVEEAIAEYREGIRLDPSIALAHNHLASALYGRKDYNAAGVVFRDLTRLKPADAHAWYMLGMSLRYSNDPDGAVTAFRETIGIDPNHTDARIMLGNTLRVKGDRIESEIVYRDALARDPGNALARYNLAYLLQEGRNFTGAEREYLEVIRVKPDYVEAINNLGRVRMERRNFPGAEAAFRKAILVRPDYPDAHNNLGNALKNQGDTAGAVAAYLKATELNPKLLEAHFNLGELYYGTGNMEAAVTEFQAVLGINPDEPETLVYLGLALSRLGRFVEAMGPLRRGHDRGHMQVGWPFPDSAELMSRCEDLAKVETKLASVLAGKAEPAGSAERVAFADMCRVFQKRYAVAVRFAQEAMTTETALVRDPANNVRYNAACAAALAASGRGFDPPPTTERPGLRRQAMDWLTADLAAWRESAARSPARAHAVMTHWRKDVDLVSVRNAFYLAALPPSEAAEWLALWADVHDLWEKTTPAIAPFPRQARR